MVVGKPSGIRSGVGMLIGSARGAATRPGNRNRPAAPSAGRFIPEVVGVEIGPEVGDDGGRPVGGS